MPIVFVSLEQEFVDKIKKKGYEAFCMRIEEYVPTKKTYYVSPANSLCFMDGGIDYALSRILFPGVEHKVKRLVREIGKTNLLGRQYLPIGSSLIINEGVHRLVVAPTMLLPQNVSVTKNAYYATLAALYMILVHQNEDIANVDILFTSFCCGYGKMSIDTSIEQILQGIQDYKSYVPNKVGENYILHEPNLLAQPKYYQNTEWFSVPPSEIQKV